MAELIATATRIKETTVSNYVTSMISANEPMVPPLHIDK